MKYHPVGNFLISSEIMSFWRRYVLHGISTCRRFQETTYVGSPLSLQTNAAIVP
jgi:hypothetical protein